MKESSAPPFWLIIFVFIALGPLYLVYIILGGRMYPWEYVHRAIAPDSYTAEKCAREDHRALDVESYDVEKYCKKYFEYRAKAQ